MLVRTMTFRDNRAITLIDGLAIIGASPKVR